MQYVSNILFQVLNKFPITRHTLKKQAVYSLRQKIILFVCPSHKFENGSGWVKHFFLFNHSIDQQFRLVAGKSTRCAVHSDIVHNMKDLGYSQCNYTHQRKQIDSNHQVQATENNNFFRNFFFFNRKKFRCRSKNRGRWRGQTNIFFCTLWQV